MHMHVKLEREKKRQKKSKTKLKNSGREPKVSSTTHKYLRKKKRATFFCFFLKFTHNSVLSKKKKVR